MDHDEDQLMEFEALEAIFVDDYEVVSDKIPRSVRLCLAPMPGQDEENHVVISVLFTLPESYPDVLPEIEISPVKGLTDKHCENLLNIAKEEGENSIGMPMIFTISEILKDWLVENNRDHTDESMHAQMMLKIENEEREKQALLDAEEAAAAKLREQEDEEDDGKPRKVEGTPVTVETYNEWLAKFIKEHEEAQERELAAAESGTRKPQNVAPDAHLTGREIFELKDKPVEGEKGSTDIEEWDVQEDLFLDEGEDLSDLDDLSDDEED